VQNLIEVKDLYKSFGKLEVLKGISFSAKTKDIISIVGRSGSGKSTLLRCLNLLETPEQGSLRILGQDIEFRPTPSGGREVANHAQVLEIRSKAAMVFQQFNLWAHMTVLQNVMEAPQQVLGLTKNIARETAERYLETVGMIDKCKEYPARLSGGQQQRVAIARALAMEPQILLFDEPTSALDPELVGEVLQVIRKLAEEGRTMLVVTHEMGFAREISSEIIFLHDGLIEEQGAAEIIFTKSKSERFRQFISTNY